MKTQLLLSTHRQHGDLDYEYHPFRNLQLEEDVQIIDGFYVPKGKAVNTKTGEILTEHYKEEQVQTGYDQAGHPTYKTIRTVFYVDKFGNVIYDAGENAGNYDFTDERGYLVKRYDDSKQPDMKAGQLVELDTDQLNFDLEHPVEIEVQPSYDGSVNLILNDDKNIPRLINSRFSVRENNTYEIVDRIGENDTNIYSSSHFDRDSSLYLQYSTNPIVTYEGFVSGSLKVGQYCFYFQYCDADDNESDYITETGVIPVFIGSDGNWVSMEGGIKNQESNKGIKLKLTNLDGVYNYLKVSYVRYFADYQQNRVTEAFKVINKYPVNGNEVIIQITGGENVETISPEVINISKFNATSVKTQAQCKNMLFYGNIVKNSDNYKELADCALRIIPTRNTNVTEYNQYSSKNLVDNIGYQSGELYRFGVVFIYQNGTLSNVYNTLGVNLNPTIKYITNSMYEKSEESDYLLTRKYIKIDSDGMIKEYSDFFDIKQNNYIKEEYYLNARGVCRFPKHENIMGIQFSVPDEVISQLKKLGIRGLFFVRQKRKPLVIAQTVILPFDSKLGVPAFLNQEGKVLQEALVAQRELATTVRNDFWSKVMNDVFRATPILTNDFKSRIFDYSQYAANPLFQKNFQDTFSENKAYAGICPDFLLNQPYYNQIFNSSSFILRKRGSLQRITGDWRFYEYHQDLSKSDDTDIRVKICSVTEQVQTVAIENQIYKLKIGTAENGASHELIGWKLDDLTEDEERDHRYSNIARGIYSPYLAIYRTEGPALEWGSLYDIYLDTTNFDLRSQFLERMNNIDAYYAISDRINFGNKTSVRQTCFRGDCHKNSFYYRLNRNFNDPTLPTNDNIIGESIENGTKKQSLYKHWEPDKLIRSDVNAVQLGVWIRVFTYSSYPASLRSIDNSFVSEAALMGSPRSFYPHTLEPWRGTYKMPDSYLYNDAFRASLGYKCYYDLQNINYLKNTFSNRIQYSSIAIQDSFKNNYRDSSSVNFRDYSSEYGGITKLIGFEGYLLVIFEHGIGLAVINERVLAGTGDGNPVYINTQNVLPEELTIISDTYGTQWSESVIKTEAGYVYGVDTVCKKIWRVKGQEIEIISDFKVNKFLIENLNIGEREKTPIIGIRNVKTHYNNNKKDVMFTFYNTIYKEEEKVWNLCFNELLNQFITFYSWVPSYSENIDTQYFSFNRKTSQIMSLISRQNYYNTQNLGVVIDNYIFDGSYFNLYYRTKGSTTFTVYDQTEATTSTFEVNSDNSSTSFNRDVKFKLNKDGWGNYKKFEIKSKRVPYYTKNSQGTFDENYFNQYYLQRKSNTSLPSIVYLEVIPYISETQNNGTLKNTYFKTETIVLLKQNTKNNSAFYLHGKAGIFDVIDDLKPCYWYDEQHPFEFEFVVNDKIGQQKIFENLIIISNKAEPESFHFEIEGDNYSFSDDKRAMYIRQESTKELFQNMGSDVLFNRDYPSAVNGQQYYRPKDSDYESSYVKSDRVYPVYSTKLVQQVKSTIFHLYYNRVDTFEDIYHKYTQMKGQNQYDFKNLSGSEILWDKELNQFNIVTHIKNSPINLVGRLRGNSYYKEGNWNIQIPSIIFSQKNESDWVHNENLNYTVPPVVINNIPDDLNTYDVSLDILPNIFDKTMSGDDINKYVKNSNGWTNRKETKIRDKWIKIRVRYSGKDLAIINNIITLYNISYS